MREALGSIPSVSIYVARGIRLVACRNFFSHVFALRSRWAQGKAQVRKVGRAQVAPRVRENARWRPVPSHRHCARRRSELRGELASDIWVRPTPTPSASKVCVRANTLSGEATLGRQHVAPRARFQEHVLGSAARATIEQYAASPSVCCGRGAALSWSSLGIGAFIVGPVAISAVDAV